MRLRMGWFMIALASMLWVTACGGNQNSASDKQAGTEVPSGTVTLYTSVPESLANEFTAKFQEKYPKVNVTIYRGDTTDIMVKMQTEKKANAVSADVVWVADVTAAEGLKQRELLDSYDSPEGKALPDDVKDPGGFWYGSRLINLVVAYNTLQVKELPKSWKDLIDPKYAKKVVVPSANAGSVLYGVGTVIQSDEYGWDYFKQMKSNGAIMVKNNNDAAQRIVTGEMQIGMVLDYIVTNLKDNGSPIDYIIPQEGVLTVTSPIAIAKDSKNKALAQLFLDFTISKEGQSILASQSVVPVRSDIETPEGVPTPDELKRFPGNAEYVSEHADEIKTQFDEIFK